MSEDPVEEIARIILDAMMADMGSLTSFEEDCDAAARALIDAGRITPEGMTALRMMAVAESVEALWMYHVPAPLYSGTDECPAAVQLRAWAHALPAPEGFEDSSGAAVLDRSVQVNPAQETR